MSTAVLTPKSAAPALSKAAPVLPRVLSQPLQPYRWTIQEYRKLYKTGLFFDCKTMLLHGELYVIPLLSPMHSTASARVENYLRGAFPTNPHVRVEKAFDIGTHNDPGPDVAVVPGTIDDYESKHPTTAILILEIAVSSMPTDMNVKSELYAAAKVPEYWVLDVEGRELHILRDPVAQPAGLGSNAYRSHQTVAAKDSVSPLAAPTASAKVEDLLPKLTP